MADSMGYSLDNVVNSFDELPDSWCTGKLRQVVISRKGNKPKTLISESRDGFVPYILIDQMEGKPATQFTDDNSVPISSASDILIVWDGSIGKTASGIVGAVGSTIAALTPILIEPSYLEYFLRLCKPYIEQNSRGSGLQHINPDVLGAIDVPIAPLAEQKRIATKIAELLPLVDAVGKRLNKISSRMLDTFRNSVLSAACSGKLTQKWRINHLDVEPADLLLKRIESEHPRKQKREEFKSSNDDLPELPEKWEWSSVQKVCTDIVDCPHSTPKWTDSGIICLRTTNFLPGYLDLSNVRYVSPKTYKERTSRLCPASGDIVYSREGGILGIACMIPEGYVVCLGQRMMLMRTDNKNYLSKILMYNLNSPFITALVREQTGGTSSPHLNVGDINQFPVPVPPIQEQYEIVSCVDALFRLADNIEKRIETARLRADKLDQSILTKAFHGELVPTEAELASQERRSYEPAMVLLERIKAQKRATKRV